MILIKNQYKLFLEGSNITIHYLYEIILPLISFIILTISCWITDVDIYLERLFYDSENEWYLKDHTLFKGLYNQGRYPGIFIFFSSILIYILSFFFNDLVKYRGVFSFLIIYMAVGPGLIINGILKTYWKRPRPRQIKIFGGKHDFVNVCMIGDSGRNSSFCCGHASMGFYLIFPYFFLKNIDPLIALFFLVIGILFGLIIGLARMAQGGHFFSDVIWSLGIMYFTGLILYYLMNPLL